MRDPARPAADDTTSSYAARPWLAHYPPGVPADFAFPQVPVTRLLDDAAASFPSRVAVAFLGSTLTYRELKDAVDHLAAGLAELGVRKGDRVALVLANCPQYVLTVYAVLRLGAVLVPADPLADDSELRTRLADSGARVVVCLDRVVDAVRRVRGGTALEHVVVTSLADYLPLRTRLRLRLPLPGARRTHRKLPSSVVQAEGLVPFVRLLRTSPPARQTPVDPARDLALLQYTGGTTGASRGARLTHANLVSNAYMNRLWDHDGRAGAEVTIAVLPLFHVFGLTVCLNATVLLAGTLVLLPRFDLDLLFDAVDRWRPTLLPGVPRIFAAVADSPHAGLHDLSSLRVTVSGAMRLPEQVHSQFERVSGTLLVEGYGLTECAPSTHCNPLSDRRRPGTIGLPLPGTSCRVVGLDDPGSEVPVGTPGELLVKGPQVFGGYWGTPTTSSVLTSDGYLPTGDIVVMDEDGFFRVLDRKQDVIVSGGRITSPSEVEEVLRTLPGVQDAVVVGVPDHHHRGEVVKAYVVAPGRDLTEADVVAHCSSHLTGHAVPRSVEFRSALPRTVVGTVLRRQLRQEELARGAEGSGRKSGAGDGRSSST